jgi:hypothetical protein
VIYFSVYEIFAKKRKRKLSSQPCSRLPTIRDTLGYIVLMNTSHLHFISGECTTCIKAICLQYCILERKLILSVAASNSAKIMLLIGYRQLLVRTFMRHRYLAFFSLTLNISRPSSLPKIWLKGIVS